MKISDTNKKMNSWFFDLPLIGGVFKFLYSISPASYISYSLDANELRQELGYEPKYQEDMPNRASKCYLILFFPLVLVSIVSIIYTLISFVFFNDIILFFDEYIKLIALIIPFLILFLWITPTLFFKFFFPNEKKDIQIYAYGALVAIILPLLIIPRDYHSYYGKQIEIIGTVTSVYNNSRKQKMNSITFMTTENKLKKMKLADLSSHLINNANIGDRYMIKGRKSKFYFTYDSIVKYGAKTLASH
ncbi:MAG: hypothetical protein L0Y61_00985 [Epsilonproteobacteria bacterium]|nr:hypothetical protein [Campylobacterota bacterium]